jgi:hypothetical protein
MESRPERCTIERERRGFAVLPLRYFRAGFPLRPSSRRPSFATAITILVLLVAATTGAQPARWTADQWIDDLDYLRVRMRSSHGNPFHTVDHQALDAEFHALRAAIPNLSDFEIAFGMQKLIASLGDGHSWLEFAEKGLGRFFLLEAAEFSDGLFITRAGPGSEGAAGCRVVAVGGTPIESLRDRLAPFISRDNDMDLLRQVPVLLAIAPALYAAGISDAPEAARFTLATDAGDTFEQRFAAVDKKVYTAWLREKPAAGELPRYRRNIDENYRYDILAPEGLLYFQFNRFTEIKNKPFRGFLDELFDDFDARNLRGLIIDLRNNQGGWIKLLPPLLDHIRKRPQFEEPGTLYLLTSRDTFSASLMLVVRLQRDPGAVLVGEPGRGKPNSYSEIGPFELPNTGLLGTLSARYYQEADPLDQRTRVEVDIAVPVTYGDYRDGRDPVLDATLSDWRARQP